MKNFFATCKDINQVKREYKKLSKKYHPDVNKSPDANEKFKEIVNERDKKIREIMRAEGKSEYDMQEVIDNLGTADFMNSIHNAATGIAQELIDEGIIDKTKPDGGISFAKLFTHVLGKINKNLDEKPDQKKLPPTK